MSLRFALSIIVQENPMKNADVRLESSGILHWRQVSRGEKRTHLWRSSESHFSFALQVCNAVSSLEHARSGVMVLTDFSLQSSAVSLTAPALKSLPFLAYSASPQAKSRFPPIFSPFLELLCRDSARSHSAQSYRRGKEQQKKVIKKRVRVFPMGKIGIYRKIGAKSSCWTWGWVGKGGKKHCRNGIDIDSGT